MTRSSSDSPPAAGPLATPRLSRDWSTEQSWSCNRPRTAAAWLTRAAESSPRWESICSGVVVNRIDNRQRETIYADASSYGYAYTSDSDPDSHDKHSSTVPLDEPLTAAEEMPAARPAPNRRHRSQGGWREREQSTTERRRPYVKKETSHYRGGNMTSFDSPTQPRALLPTRPRPSDG